MEDNAAAPAAPINLDILCIRHVVQLVKEEKKCQTMVLIGWIGRGCGERASWLRQANEIHSFGTRAYSVSTYRLGNLLAR